MKRDISSYHLGGTLFVPATHKNLEKILLEDKIPNLKSLLICLEDSISNSDVDSAMDRVKELLATYTPSNILLFIRPRNINMLKELMDYKYISKLDGFILPKFCTTNMQEYISLMSDEYYYMPSLESIELFDTAKLIETRDRLLLVQDKILSIRVGSEDMLSYLGIKKDCNTSSYDILPLATTLSNVLTIFKPYGFNISATVYKCYKEHEKFADEVKRDMINGFFSKTLIHPSQVDIINNLYKVSQDEYDIATKIVSSDEAILTNSKEMYEKKPHTNWAKSIIARYKIYGII